MVKYLVLFRNIEANFTACYLIFFLFILFLTKLVHALDEKQHKLLIALCGVTYILFETLPGFSVIHNYVSWFMVLFVIGSYLRLYPKKIYEKTHLWGTITAGLVVLSIFSVLCSSYIYVKTGYLSPFSFVADSNNLLPVCLGISSFLFFKNLKMDYYPWINTIGATTFGVLLIHANSDTMRQWLWKDLLDVSGHYSVSWFWIHALGSVLAVFVMCSLLDMLCIRLIEKPFFGWLDNYLSSSNFYRKLNH